MPDLRMRPRSRRPGFDPLMLGSALKIWLDVSQSTSDVNGVSSVPDRMGGAAAVQAVNAQKPQLSTTSNGLSKLVLTDDVLLLPLSAPLTDPNNFGIAFWMKPANITTSSDLFGVSSAFSGTASSNRIQIRQTTDDLIVFLWATASNIRSGRSLAVNALLQPNVWTFFSYEFTAAGVTEVQKSKFKTNGTPLSPRNAMDYADAQNTVGSPGPLTLLTGMTGNANIFGRAAGANPFQGEATDVFIYDPSLMSTDALVALAQYEVPVG